MALQKYREKRDFKATSEPEGGTATEHGNSFVIQKHAATRLHYDLRLEMDGVLKSWAVTRGPSLVPTEKRLAVEVEDHPLDYGTFEGTIPKGSYGAGAVIVWDRGTWEPRSDVAKGLAKGHLEFALDGEKLGGKWHLVRIKGKPDEKRVNWLLMKSDDAFARADTDPDILEAEPKSVLSGRLLEELKAETKSKPAASKSRNVSSKKPKTKPAKSSGGTKKADLPLFVPPLLASLGDTPKTGTDWIHEIKFDGYRIQARIEGGQVKLLTRSGHDWTDRFGTGILSGLADLTLDAALIDGEIVVEGRDGRSDFSALQADLKAGRTDRFVYYAFDLLHLDGADLTQEPLINRRATLTKLVAMDSGPLRFSVSFEDKGGTVFRHACQLGLEGIISKRGNAPYRSGRSRDWIKSKCMARQEFVIGGYMPSSASRKAIGSLLLGVYDGDRLRHVGRVGTGFTAAVARDLFTQTQSLRQDNSAFSEPLTADQARRVQFLRPDLVAEVEFSAWTADGHLRHASFRGLREDKDPSEIVAEQTPTPEKVPDLPRHAVKLTHPDRVYWPEEGVTKEGMADYYTMIWPQIAPFLTSRPLALLRCPTGITGQQFFQKHLWKGAGRHIRSITDAASSDPLIGIDSLDGLISLVQAGSLEIHPWGALSQDLERPDQITMDLDPGENITWQDIIAGATEVQARLADDGLASFVKTSGGKGLHVVVPLKPRADWAAVKAYTKTMAQAMAADSPDRFVATVTKAKRKGRILIDYLRNQRGATAVAAYSTRARPGAAVSAPLTWEELALTRSSDQFTLRNMAQRQSGLTADPWDGFSDAAVPLPKSATG